MIKAEYFIDAEFFESPGVLIPISLGIVSAHDGRELHLVCSDNVDQFRAGYGDPWIEENVISKLPPREEWLSRAECAEKIAHFIAGTNPQFWAYYAAHDWVCFCWFCDKRIIDLPPGWPRFCFDLKQIAALGGVDMTSLIYDCVRVDSDYPPLGGLMRREMDRLSRAAGFPDARIRHNALEDARWAVEVWRRLFPSGYRRRP